MSNDIYQYLRSSSHNLFGYIEEESEQASSSQRLAIESDYQYMESQGDHLVEE